MAKLPTDETNIHLFPAEAIDEIIVQKWNPNPRGGNIGKSPEDTELLAYIKSGNPVPPLGVSLTKTETGQRLILINGHRRLWAYKKALSQGTEIKQIPLIVLGRDLNTADMLAMTLADNNGKPHSKSELAGAIVRLQNFKWSNRTIAKKIGISESRVRELETFHNAIPEIQHKVDNGTIPENTARAIVAKTGGDSNAQQVELDKVESEIESGTRTKTGRRRYEAVSCIVETARLEVYEQVLLFLKEFDTVGYRVLETEVQTMMERLEKERDLFIKKQKNHGRLGRC